MNFLKTGWMALLISLTALAGTDTVGNAGLVENQFVYVWTNLSSFVKVCASAGDCSQRLGLSGDETSVLLGISAQVTQFKPLLFIPDYGEGPSPWSPLVALSPDGSRALIHAQALYSDADAVRAGGSLHESLPYLTVAAGLLTRQPPQVAWTLGLKLRKFWNRRGQVLSAEPLGLKGVYFQAVDPNGAGTEGLWLVSDANQIQDLTRMVTSQLPCGPGSLVRTTNLDWAGPAAVSGNVTQVRARGEIVYSCGSVSGQADVQIVLTTVSQVLDLSRSFVQISNAR